MTEKKITGLYQARGRHWVGDGFHVHGIFNYQNNPDEFSPFLLLDFAEGEYFPATDAKLGVGQHPHRGFETVTVVFAGEAQHRDSQGNGGVIGPGDVQWMTAGSGIIHEEYHSRDFAKKGGMFEMAQLWVNLPKEYKMAAPGYQHLSRENIPAVSLPGGEVKVIAGEYSETKGPAKTFTPVNLWNVRLDPETKVTLPVPAGQTTLVLVVRGFVVAEEKNIRTATVIAYDREAEGLTLHTGEDEAVVLVMTGERIAEPVVGHGPFVMNSAQEIYEALDDFEKGRFLQHE